MFAIEYQSVPMQHLSCLEGSGVDAHGAQERRGSGFRWAEWAAREPASSAGRWPALVTDTHGACTMLPHSVTQYVAVRRSPYAPHNIAQMGCAG